MLEGKGTASVPTLLIRCLGFQDFSSEGVKPIHDARPCPSSNRDSALMTTSSDSSNHGSCWIRCFAHNGISTCHRTECWCLGNQSANHRNCPVVQPNEVCSLGGRTGIGARGESVFHQQHVKELKQRVVWFLQPLLFCKDEWSDEMKSTASFSISFS